MPLLPGYALRALLLAAALAGCAARVSDAAPDTSPDTRRIIDDGAGLDVAALPDVSAAVDAATAMDTPDAADSLGVGDMPDASDTRAVSDALVAPDATVTSDVSETHDAFETVDVLTPDVVSLPETHRVSGRAVVGLLTPDPVEPWWLDEQLVPFTMAVGDLPTGISRVMRRLPGAAEDTVVWQPDAAERITDAVRHPSGAWSAVLYNGDSFAFLAHGDAHGLTTRIALTDDTPDVDANGPGATPPLTLLPAGERGLRLVADGEDVVVVLTNAASGVLAYRYTLAGGAWLRQHRTLVTPAAPTTPKFPTGGSYDVFGAIWNRFTPHAALDPADGSTYVALVATPRRVAAHNALFGTALAIQTTGTVLPRGDSPRDIMIVRVDRSGAVVFARVLGNVDVDDDVYAVTVGGGLVAAVGRSRRGPGFDNSELDVIAAIVRTDGTEVGVFTYDAPESGIAQSAAFERDGALLVGGTEAWTMNPSGISVFTNGTPFVRRLRAGAWTAATDVLPPTTGHSEVRALVVDGARVWAAGLENGPLTHTADGDLSLVRADGYWSRR